MASAFHLGRLRSFPLGSNPRAKADPRMNLSNQHVYPTAGGWYYDKAGLLFGTKGAAVAHLRDNEKMKWKVIANSFPGGTVANCMAAYRYYLGIA
jgi:hypothetical protein